MTGQASDRLRAALERLDMAIDMLEARVAAAVDGHAFSPGEDTANGAIAERIDRMIERIETALGE